MLKGIDPLLSGDLLKILDDMDGPYTKRQLAKMFLMNMLNDLAVCGMLTDDGEPDNTSTMSAFMETLRRQDNENN